MAQEKENLTFLSGMNAEYIAHLYGEYLAAPAKVDESWQHFFSTLRDDERALLLELNGASWTPPENRKSSRGFNRHLQPVQENIPAGESYGRRAGDSLSREDIKQAASDAIRTLMLVRAYRVRGHLMADLDPLHLKEKSYHPELDPAHYGFSPADYNRSIFVGGVLGMEYATLTEIIAVLEQTYCNKIGVEFVHLSDPEEKAWIQERIEEPRNKTEFTVNGKRAILQRLIAAEVFEQFLHKKYTGTKRFGIDGGEALIPLMEQIMKRGSQLGLEEIIIGMAHRGRLNVLANVMGKPFTTIFAEFQGQSSTPDDVMGSGDVKYHLGTSSDRDFDGCKVHLSLTANPSHLEFVNPVVSGKVRAKQVQRGDIQSGAVLPLILHGDAAFAGQGITAETLMISELPGYRVGGTIHIVINNQIGFTTMPKYSRS
ncbi:MAG: 2-oxoglutarate dehydrogenase E1 component, partial [Alphaproteobacteria bacterium]|nr:2-oxoglutarate dehydrogenase E1 component [Alphaproteobacteria bacterium]